MTVTKEEIVLRLRRHAKAQRAFAADYVSRFNERAKIGSMTMREQAMAEESVSEAESNAAAFDAAADMIDKSGATP